MDFSPYRKNKISNRPSFIKKGMPYLLLVVACGIGFFIFWLLKSYFFQDEGSSIISRFETTNASAQTQIEGMGVWTNLLDDGLITEGDTVRIVEGDDGAIVLPDGSVIRMGEGSDVFIKTLKKDENDKVFGDVYIESSPVLFSGTGRYTEEGLKIWVRDSLYIDGGESTFVVEGDNVHVVEGENIRVVQVNTEGKIAAQKNLGIGQSLNMASFSLMATPKEIEYFPLIALYKGEETKPTPASEGLTESSSLSVPEVVSPAFSGAAIEVSSESQKIEGKASLDTEKIVIVFSNGDEEEELSFSTSASDNGIDKEWSYTASPLYETLKEGINTYKIYGVDAQGERSKPTVLVLSYDTEASGANVYEDVTGEFLITSPNQGRDTVVKGNIITLSGTASSDVAFITVENKKLQNSYTLKEYKAGQKTWKYWTSNVEAGVYDYVVYGKDKNGKVLYTKTMTITLTAAASTPAPAASPSLAATATAQATPVETDTSTPVPTVTPEPTPTSTPPVTLSTMEAVR